MRPFVRIGPALVVPEEVIAITSDGGVVGLHLTGGGVVAFRDAHLADDLVEVARLLGAAVPDGR